MVLVPEGTSVCTCVFNTAPIISVHVFGFWKSNRPTTTSSLINTTKLPCCRATYHVLYGAERNESITERGRGAQHSNPPVVSMRPRSHCCHHIPAPGDADAPVLHEYEHPCCKPSFMLSADGRTCLSSSTHYLQTATKKKAKKRLGACTWPKNGQLKPGY